MSQRTIIEINHDYLHDIEKDGLLFISFLRRALASGADVDWIPLRHYGINKVVQLHHSDERKVVTNFGEFKIG